MVSDVPMTEGWALQVGSEVAEIIALDPMLAVVEVAERQLAGLKLGDVAGVKLVTGEEVQELLGIPPGPAVGKALATVRRAQVDGRVRTKEEALGLLRDSL